MTDTAQKNRGRVRTLQGTVVSDKADKTVTVAITRLVKHPRYGKYIRRSSTFQVHDPNNSVQCGDTVMIAECRPISKNKTWKVFKLINRPESVE